MSNDFTVDFEASQTTGMRCLAATPEGTQMATAYSGYLGGAVLKKLDDRRTGAGSPVYTFPAGFALASFTGPLPTGAAIDQEAKYLVTCIDPGGSDVDPVPNLVAFAALVTP
jgi:hypothetical protein